MPVNTYHLRSSVKGKEPAAGNSAGQLPVGSIAINFHADEPFLTIQDSAGSVRRIAGVKIDATAPTTPTAGEWWVDTSGATKIVKVFDGTSWVATGSPMVDATDTAKGVVELATAAEVTTGTDTTRAVTPAGLKVELDKKAPLASPALTGTPTAPTAAAGTNTTQLATTEFVTTAVAAENLWDRTGTVVSPATAGDQVHTATGKLTVGGTAAAPNLEVKADGGIVANTNGLVYNAATKRLGIGTTDLAEKLEVLDGNIGLRSAGSAVGDRTTERFYKRTDIGSTNGTAAIGMNGAGTNGFLGEIKFYTGASDIFNTSLSERARIDRYGRLLVGTSSARTNFFNVASGRTSRIQVEGLNYQDAAFAVICNADSTDKGIISFAKSRSTAVGGNTIVANADDLGEIAFQGADGTEFVQAAGIKAQVDGTPGLNKMPGRIVLLTTAAGAFTPTERMRIKSTGIVNIVNTPTHADNATAKTGGLVAGDIYRKADGTLMIVF